VAAMMVRARDAARALLRLAGARAGVHRDYFPPLARATFARAFLDFRKVAASSPFLLVSSATAVNFRRLLNRRNGDG
jgi:hypothetical protein